MRASWDEYFLGLADKVSERATCDRAHVGAIIVKDNQIIATGYNGSPPKQPHCDDVGHIMRGGHCIATIHAELNALLQAAKHGHSVDGATIYVTHYPCFECSKALVTAGIKKVVYASEYRRDDRPYDPLDDIEVVTTMKTPSRREYLKIKAREKDSLLLFRHDGVDIVVCEDAEYASKFLGTSTEKSGNVKLVRITREMLGKLRVNHRIVVLEAQKG